MGSKANAFTARTDPDASRFLRPATEPACLRQMRRRRLVDCTPPSSSALCSALHAQIRSQFSLREIGMLFGARTSYPEAQTAYDGLHVRYRNLLREVAANIAPSDAVAAR